MNYQASVGDFFKSPQWGMNLLLGSVASLIPAVGPIVLSGWLISLFWARRDSEDPARFPAFDFQFFGKYLERGLWPFLVQLVASLALMPVMMVVMFAMMFGAGAFAPHTHHAPRAAMGAFGVALIGGAMLLNVGVILVFNLVTLPLTLRATIAQNFAQAFNLGFVRRFLALVWMETFAAFLFMFGLALGMLIVAVLTCYVGLFPAVVIVSFAWHHLQKQLYQLYLSRGGEAVALSAKLVETPPALPPVALPPLRG